VKTYARPFGLRGLPVFAKEEVNSLTGLVVAAVEERQHYAVTVIGPREVPGD
jgi:hypothetical protein